MSEEISDLEEVPDLPSDIDSGQPRLQNISQRGPASSSHSEHESCEPEAWTHEHASSLDAMIREATLATLPSVSVQLPWETGLMQQVFAPDVLEVVPVPKHDGGLIQVDRPNPDLKRRKRQGRPAGPCVHMRIVDLNNQLADKDLEARWWSSAVEKWYRVIVLGGSRILETGRGESKTEACDTIRALLGWRSARTAGKRASDLLRFVRWRLEHFMHGDAFPLHGIDIQSYISALDDTKASPSSLTAFLESVHFAVHVIGCEVSDEVPLVSRLTQGLVDRSQLRRAGRKQARPLSVAEVLALESVFADPECDPKDCHAAGAFLFAVYSRSRWSDLRRVYRLIEDFSMEGGKAGGYVEFSTRSHKTASLVARSGLVMPLVAPVWGLKAPPWKVRFLSTAKASGLDLGNDYMGPLLPAPMKDGVWGSRAVTTREATLWLRSLIALKLPPRLRPA